jgi:uncharacterized protein YuzE
MGTLNVTNKENIQLDTNSIKNIKDFVLTYHEDEDTLFIRPNKPRPATSFDWNGEIWVRVNPENGEIVGLEIDDFEAVFLKKYPEIAVAWESVKPSCHRKISRKNQESAWESFSKIVLNFLLTFFRENPYQASFNPV